MEGRERGEREGRRERVTAFLLIASFWGQKFINVR